jgi:hypothetical protein
VQLSSITDSSIASVPEPRSFSLWVLGAIGLAVRRLLVVLSAMPREVS